MMKKINICVITCFLVFLNVIPSFSKKVDEKDAIKVAKQLLKDNSKDSKTIDKIIPSVQNKDTTLYFVTFKDSGFVIISADYSAPPVLGECYDGKYDDSDMPPGFSIL